ncbi:MAG: F0F1 ATP synthase subunit alpha [Candidatus Paceibacterota bacterium]
MSTNRLVDNLKSKIENFESEIEVREVGRVIEVADGIAQLVGLEGVQSQEMLRFPDTPDGKEVLGIALNLEEGVVGAIILGEFAHIGEGDTVERTGNILSVPVGDDMIGRIVDPLMRPIDGKGDIDSTEEYLVERRAPGVMERQPVDQPLQTGIKAIDAMIPIGRGQRELIIGDRQTGKTTLAIDTILNQKDEDVLCIYVAIGQKRSKVARIVSELEEAGAMDYTTVVLAGASDGASYAYISPYAGVALGEYFMDQGKDVLIIYDDLSKHATAYREISLLLRRPPGREAYPGDVFYLHSRLLERAARRNEKAGGGSITALPIIETQAGDLSAYIPTNVISITDGQIFLEAGIFNRGIRPAVNVGNSVSRVGGSAQIKSMKKVAGKLRTQLAQFREIEAFAQFASDLDPATKKQLDRGERLVELLKQPQSAPVPVGIQIALIYTANQGLLDDIEVDDISRFEKEYRQFLLDAKRDLVERATKEWSDEVQEELTAAAEQFLSQFND